MSHFVFGSFMIFCCARIQGVLQAVTGRGRYTRNLGDLGWGKRAEGVGGPGIATVVGGISEADHGTTLTQTTAVRCRGGGVMVVAVEIVE